MRVRCELLWVTAAAMLLTSAAVAQPAHFWQPTLETARRAAAQTNRLVLIYFCADWCPGCRAMEQEVFSQPGVQAELQTNFVPVKVNADYFPSTAKQYGITALPTTVVATPEGQAIEKMRGRVEAAPYVARLGQVAADAKRQGAAVYAQIPGGPPTAAVTQANASSTGPGYQAPAEMRQPETRRQADYAGQRPPTLTPASGPAINDPAAGDYGRPPWAAGAAPAGVAPPPGTQPPFSPGSNYPPPQVAGQPPVVPPSYTPPSSGPSPDAARTNLPPTGAVARPSPSPQAAQSPASNPSLGLDGYCPVRLAEAQLWAMGDRRWGVVHRGRTYLFTGPDERNRFYADPDRYAPVLSGNDAVAMVDQGRAAPGHREHGVFFGNRVYLFADEASLQKFGQNANYYADQALQAGQFGAPSAQRPR